MRQFFWRISPIDWLAFNKPIEGGLFASIQSRKDVDRAGLVPKCQVCTCRGDGRGGYYRMCIELQRVSSCEVGRALVMLHLIELVDIRICAVDDVHETLIRNDYQTCVFLW